MELVARLTYDRVVATPDAPAFEGLSAADVMLGSPKTIGPDATVAAARERLAHPSVRLLLVADADGRFRGAIRELPPDAPADGLAVDFAEAEPDVLAPDAPAAAAFDAAARSVTGRVVVLDGDRLAGLVCLDATRTRFCGTAAHG